MPICGRDHRLHLRVDSCTLERVKPGIFSLLKGVRDCWVNPLPRRGLPELWEKKHRNSIYDGIAVTGKAS